MKKLKFEIEIDAPAKKVWKSLWDDTHYRDWTSAFSQGSYAVSDWKEGSKIQFLSPTGEGMYSKIEKAVPEELMSFRHIGVIKDGKEQPLDEETKKWTGAMEKYKLEGENGHTKLEVELDIVEDHAGYFSDTFPKALQRVKEISEAESA